MQHTLINTPVERLLHTMGYNANDVQSYYSICHFSLSELKEITCFKNQKEKNDKSEIRINRPLRLIRGIYKIKLSVSRFKTAPTHPPPEKRNFD